MVAKVIYTHRIMLLLYVLFVVNLFFSIYQLNLSTTTFLMVVSIKLIPLLLPLPGMIQKVATSVIWLCFMLCVYFIGGVLEITSHFYNVQSWFSAILSCLLFISGLLFIKLSQLAKK